MNNILIRSFKESDTKEIIKLFHDAVHTINSKHYSLEQIAIWAPATINEEKWKNSLSQNITFVAEIDGIIVGFIDMTHEGYLDRLYIHKDYQGRFIALHLLKTIEKTAQELGLSKIITHCSITAKVPAERMGFKIVREQIVTRKNVEMINYVMEKKLF